MQCCAHYSNICNRRSDKSTCRRQSLNRPDWHLVGLTVRPTQEVRSKCTMQLRKHAMHYHIVALTPQLTSRAAMLGKLYIQLYIM